MAIDIGGWGTTAVSVLVLILAGIMGLSMIGASFYFYFKWRKYQQYNCIIWEEDGFGQITETYDRAGIFVDSKTKNKRFFMRKANVGLTPDRIPYIPGRKKKTVYLLRTGLKNFRFIKPVIDMKVGSLALSVEEEDVNWAINAYERQKKLFTQSLLLQYLPFIALAFVCMIILIIFIYFFKEFGIMKDVAVAFKEATQAFAQAKTGTVVIS